MNKLSNKNTRYVWERVKIKTQIGKEGDPIECMGNSTDLL